MKQCTLREKVVFEGIGVHFGLQSKVILNPAPANTGIVWQNSKFLQEKIVLGKVIPELAMHASVLKSLNWMVSTIEHLMAAISAFGIDNIIVEIDGPEVPILDGSAAAFCYEFEKIGINHQEEEKLFLTPKKTINFEDGDGRYLEIVPANFCPILNSYDSNLYFDYFADFQHPLVGSGRLIKKLDFEYFSKEISPARTFGFLEQLPFLRRHGLAKGTSLGNSVVVGEDEFLNEKRFDDEFIRHKLLDLIGDLALLGKNLAGKIIAKKTGHNFNRLVVEHYIKNPDEWMLIK